MKASNSDEPGSIERNIEPSGENPPRDDDSSVDMLEAIQSAVDTLHAYSLTLSLYHSLTRRAVFTHTIFRVKWGRDWAGARRKRIRCLLPKQGGCVEQFTTRPKV